MHIRYAMLSFTPTSITTTITVFTSCIINCHRCVFNVYIYIERERDRYVCASHICIHIGWEGWTDGQLIKSLRALVT